MLKVCKTLGIESTSESTFLCASLFLLILITVSVVIPNKWQDTSYRMKWYHIQSLLTYLWLCRWNIYHILSTQFCVAFYCYSYIISPRGLCNLLTHILYDCVRAAVRSLWFHGASEVVLKHWGSIRFIPDNSKIQQSTIACRFNGMYCALKVQVLRKFIFVLFCIFYSIHELPCSHFAVSRNSNTCEFHMKSIIYHMITYNPNEMQWP